MTTPRAVLSWSPSLSPEGDRVAYVSDREGSPRVWVESLARGAAKPVDVCPHQAQSVHWSVDGEWLAILVAPGGSPRTQVWVVRPDGRDLHEVAGAEQGATFLGPWTHQPGVLAVSQTTSSAADGVARLEDAVTRRGSFVAHGGQPLVLDLDRGARLALVRRGPRGQRTVWAIDRITGEEEMLLPGGGPGSTDLGRLSPDGRVAYVRSDAGREMHALLAVRLARRGEPQSALVLAERPDADLDHIALTADGLEAILLWNVGGQTTCERMDLRTLQRVELPLPEAVAHDCSFSHDGHRLALTLEGPTAPRAVWVHDARASSWTRVTEQIPGWLAPTVRPSLERLRAHDGLEISGWLYRPIPSDGAAQGLQAPGPAVLHFHGGPEAQERPVYSPLFQALAARGVAVFAPNVRGSSGLGRSFVDADNIEKRWDAIRDVATCARHLVATGIASPGRLACAGRSYGGYLTLAALVFHPELFAGGVDVCGVADFQTFYAYTEPWIAVAAYPKYGHPVYDADLLRALSPIHRFDALRAPILIVHGENDSNVPIEEAEQVVAAARARGVPVEYLVFAEEGHEIAKAENRARFVEATVEWLAARLSV